MSNRSEQGASPSETFTRREVLQKFVGFTGLAAAALVFTGGCAEVDLPQVTATEGSSKPQVLEPQIQIDEGAARDLSLLYVAAIGAALFFLRGIK